MNNESKTTSISFRTTRSLKKRFEAEAEDSEQSLAMYMHDMLSNMPERTVHEAVDTFLAKFPFSPSSTVSKEEVAKFVQDTPWTSKYIPSFLEEVIKHGEVRYRLRGGVGMFREDDIEHRLREEAHPTISATLFRDELEELAHCYGVDMGEALRELVQKELAGIRTIQQMRKKRTPEEAKREKAKQHITSHYPCLLQGVPITQTQLSKCTQKQSDQWVRKFVGTLLVGKRSGNKTEYFLKITNNDVLDAYEPTKREMPKYI